MNRSLDMELAFHPLANVFPLLDGTELDALATDIRKFGLREPIVLFEEKILDGRNRYRACQNAQVEPQCTEYTGDDPLAYVVSRNLHRRHLNESQRAMVAARIATLTHGQRQSGQLADVPTQSDASEMLNVGERSVRRAREVIERGVPELAEAVDRRELAVSTAAALTELEPEEQAAIVALPKEERRQAIKAHVAHSSGQSEWYTPPTLIKSARAVMGDIDLDPASCATAQEVVQAARWYGIEEDGLNRANEWRGSVWMNPPYVQPTCEQFIARLLNEFEEGTVKSACVLVNNATETKWGQSLLAVSSAVCFPRGRVRFWYREQKPTTPLEGQMICYLGADPGAFSGEFSKYGEIFRR